MPSMSCAMIIDMGPLHVCPGDTAVHSNGYSLAKRKQRLASEIMACVAPGAKKEYNRRWSKAKYDGDPFAYNRNRLIRQLNNKAIAAPRHATILKYKLRWDQASDTWY